MKVPIVLQPAGGVIPRDLKMALRMQRQPRPEPSVAAAEVPEEEAVIGAGADDFDNATEISCEACRDILSERTYSKGFTVEAGEPEVFSGADPFNTAWWKILVPADQTIWIDLDTELSFNNEPPADTQLAVHALDGDPEFANLSRVDESEDIDATYWFSRLSPLRLQGSTSGDPAGTWFYIQVGNFNDGEPNICYVLRVSISFTEPGTKPDDADDPDA